MCLHEREAPRFIAQAAQLVLLGSGETGAGLLAQKAGITALTRRRELAASNVPQRIVVKQLQPAQVLAQGRR